MKAAALIFAFFLFLLLGCCKTYDNFKEPGSIDQDSHEIVVYKITKIKDYVLPQINNNSWNFIKIQAMMRNLGVGYFTEQWQLDTVLKTLDSNRQVPLFDFNHFILVPYKKTVPKIYNNEIDFQPKCMINHNSKTITFEVNTSGRYCSSGLNSSYSNVDYSGWIKIARPPEGFTIIISR